MKVRDVMHSGTDNPMVTADTVFREVLETMNAKGRGAVSVVDDEGRLVGLLTDGDVRRLILSTQRPLPDLFLESAENVMTRDPKRVDADAPLEEALVTLERHEFWVLPVVEGDKLVGLLHMHPLLRAMLEAGK